MGIATSAQLSFEDRISFLKKTPFFIYLQDATLLELAECVQFTLTAHKGNRVTLEEETIYIVIEGELELSVLLPTADKKNESLGYLCKKKPGDILSKISVNKQATRKMSPQMKKLEIYLDDLHIIAKSNTILVHTEAKRLHGLLSRYPELIKPLKTILDTPIDEYLAIVPFLSCVKETKLSVLAAMCRYESYDKDETIIEENTFGTNLYIILSGSVQVLAPKFLDDATVLRRSFEWDRESSKTVAVLKEGDYFGETALFTNMPRSCSVVSLSKTLLVTVEQHVFKNFLSICPSPVSKQMEHVMKERMFCKLSTLGIPFLDGNGIPSEKLKSLADSVLLEELDEGIVVFNEGDPGDKFYIIVSGEVKVEMFELCDSVTNDDSHNFGIKNTLGLLGPGKYFGEMALVTDTPRTATVMTTRKTLLLSVDKESFLNIFSTKQAMAEFKLRLLRRRADLIHILMHPVGATAFRSFLQKRFAEENIDFWLAADEFESFVEVEDLKRLSESIYQLYCDEKAAKQVNIPHNIRQLIHRDIYENKKFDASIFTLAKLEIYQLMERDHYGKFKCSSEYQDVFHRLGILV